MSVFFFMALFMPWLLGTFFLLAFFPRVVSCSFSVGAGYLLGWFFATLFLSSQAFWGYHFDLIFTVFFGYVLTVAFAASFMLGKRSEDIATKQEDKLGKVVRLACYALLFLMAFRFFLTLVDLLVKPVFPWDGWLSWSVKAKIFYYHQNIPDLYFSTTPYWDEPNAIFSYGARHPYFISLVQTYMAMAWGHWDDGIVNLPWFGLGIAVALVVFGGLKSLGVSVFASLCVSYLVISLPIFDAHVSLGSYADAWVGLSVLIVFLLLSMFFFYQKSIFIYLLLLFCLVAYLTKNSSLIFILPSLSFVCFWLYFGGRATLFVLVVLFGAVFCVENWADAAFLDTMSIFLSEALATSVPSEWLNYNPVGSEVWTQWYLVDNWHYMFIASLSLLFLLPYKQRNLDLGLFSLSMSAFSLVLVMVVITFFSHKMERDMLVGYFNRISLHVSLVFALIPCCVYRLLSKIDRRNVF